MEKPTKKQTSKKNQKVQSHVLASWHRSPDSPRRARARAGRGQFVSSHFDCSSYTMQGKNNLANLTMPFSFLHQGSGLAGPRVFRSAFYRLYLLAFCLASVSSKSFPVFILAIQQIFSNIFWHKTDIGGPARSIWHIFWHAIWHMCLSGITSDNSRLPCYPASLLEFFLAYVAIVSSHFHCGILSHPGACDPGPAGTALIRVLRLRSGAARRTRRRRGVADIESHNPEHAGEGTTLTKWKKHMEARYRQHSPCPLWCFSQSKGMVTRYEVPKIQKMSELKSS